MSCIIVRSHLEIAKATFVNYFTNQETDDCRSARNSVCQKGFPSIRLCLNDLFPKCHLKSAQLLIYYLNIYIFTFTILVGCASSKRSQTLDTFIKFVQSSMRLLSVFAIQVK